jgi:hypothetical protein
MIFSMRSLMLVLCACGVLSAPLKADELIRAAQTRLSKLGYYKGKVDGSGGSMTCAAIRRFQVAGKLKVTGELNQQTIAQLGIDKAVPAPSYTAIGGLFAGGPLSRAGSEAQVAAIRQAQTRIGWNAGSFDAEKVPEVAAALANMKSAQAQARLAAADAAVGAGRLGVGVFASEGPLRRFVSRDLILHGREPLPPLGLGLRHLLVGHPAREGGIVGRRCFGGKLAGHGLGVLGTGWGCGIGGDGRRRTSEGKQTHDD